MGVEWAGTAFFRNLPLVLLSLSFLLGLFFTQTRISLMSVLLGFVSVLVAKCFFSESADSARGEITILLSLIYVPMLSTLFYHVHERGLLTTPGYINAAIVLSAGLMILLLPGLESITSAVMSAKSVIFGPGRDWLQIPVTGVVFSIGAAPFLFIRNRRESPFLGAMLFIVVLSVVNALNFRSSIWQPGQEQAVFVSFMSCAAVVLAWAVMESSWRNANIDELTALPGRRALMHHLGRLRSRYVIAILDIDHFKKVNDRYGHDTGDQVLRFVAAHLRDSRVGKVYRYGGEEFVIVCEGFEYESVVEALDEVRELLHKRKFTVRGVDRPRKQPSKGRSKSDSRGSSWDKTISVSASIGVSRESEKSQSPQAVLDAADKALYRAKKAGRNQTKSTR